MASDLTICPMALRSSVTAALTEVLSVRTGDMGRWWLGSHCPRKHWCWLQEARPVSGPALLEGRSITYTHKIWGYFLGAVLGVWKWLEQQNRNYHLWPLRQGQERARTGIWGLGFAEAQTREEYTIMFSSPVELGSCTGHWHLWWGLLDLQKNRKKMSVQVEDLACVGSLKGSRRKVGEGQAGREILKGDSEEKV